MLKQLYRNRKLIFRSTFIELKKRYVGSVIGVGWIFLSPLIFLAIYTVVYLYVFKLQPVGMTNVDYILYIFAGLVPLLNISEGVTAGLTSLSTERNLLKSSSFPTEIFAVKAVLSAFPSFLVGMGLVILSAVVTKHLSFFLLFLPIIMVCQLIFVLGVGWVLSLLNLVTNDLQQFMNFILMVLMVISPIAYTPRMVPKKLAILIWMNPFAYFVECYQSTVVFRRFPSCSHLIVMVLISSISFILGSLVFVRARRAVIEYA